MTVVFWHPLNLLLHCLMLLSFCSCLTVISVLFMSSHSLSLCIHTCQEPNSQCLFFALLQHFIDFSFFFFLPVLCPLFADWALCCMLVVMSQFECSQTVSRTMGIQVNKGKVNPLTHNPPVISQRQPATLLTHTQTRFPIPQSK